jgi:hypothetical protein
MLAVELLFNEFQEADVPRVGDFHVSQDCYFDRIAHEKPNDAGRSPTCPVPISLWKIQQNPHRSRLRLSKAG